MCRFQDLILVFCGATIQLTMLVLFLLFFLPPSTILLFPFLPFPLYVPSLYPFPPFISFSASLPTSFPSAFFPFFWKWQGRRGWKGLNDIFYIPPLRWWQSCDKETTQARSLFQYITYTLSSVCKIKESQAVTMIWMKLLLLSMHCSEIITS